MRRPESTTMHRKIAHPSAGFKPARRDDMRGQGRGADAWMTDSEAQKLRDQMGGEKAPVDMLSSGVYTEIPILY